MSCYPVSKPIQTLEQNPVETSSSCPCLIPVIAASLAATVGVLSLIASAYPGALGPLNTLSKLGAPISCTLTGVGVVTLIAIASVPKKTEQKIVEVTKAEKEEPTFEVKGKDLSEILTAINYDIENDDPKYIKRSAALLTEVRKDVQLFEKLMDHYLQNGKLPPIALIEQLTQDEMEIIGNSVKKVITSHKLLGALLLHLKELSCPYCSQKKLISQEEIDQLQNYLIETIHNSITLENIGEIFGEAKVIVEETIAQDDDQQLRRQIEEVHLSDMITIVMRQLHEDDVPQIEKTKGFEKVKLHEIVARIDAKKLTTFYITSHS